jgi:hypothetical protein
LFVAVPFVSADDHFDIAPYLVNGKLLTGGLDHSGNVTQPPISVYGFEFQEDANDPYNPTDPGVNQAAGVGNLPAGAAIRYNILSSLEYWDGQGEANFTCPPENTLISLMVGTVSRTLTADSGCQTGSLIQSVAGDGNLHKHFVTSLFAGPNTSNIPGDANYVAPADGIYAFSIDLTLTTADGTMYTSDPLWLVFNNGMSEGVHDAAMESFVPEPVSFVLLGIGGLMMRGRRK